MSGRSAVGATARRRISQLARDHRAAQARVAAATQCPTCCGTGISRTGTCGSCKGSGRI